MSKQEVAVRPDRAQLAAVGQRIDEIAANYVSCCQQANNDYERAVVLAASMIDLRQAIKEYMPVLKQLQGSRLGFRTDKDKDGGYPEAVIVDCALEAVMRGVRWTGNEFNIISGSCYITREGYWHLIGKLEDLTDLRLSPTVPIVQGGKTIVSYRAAWKWRGVPQSMERDIPIRVNQGMGDDAILGKAERKMLCAIYREVTGTFVSDGDTADDGEVQAAGRPGISNGMQERAANYRGDDSEKPAGELFTGGPMPAGREPGMEG